MATIIGTSGPDTLNGTAGDDLIDGGAGFDTAVIAAPSTGALYNQDGFGRWVIYTPGQGTDTLANVEAVQFSDGRVVTLGPLGDVLVYWGFGALPDAATLGHWAGVAGQLGSLGALAQAVLDAVAPDLPVQALVEHLFQQIVGRPGTADEVQGFVDMVGPGRAFTTQGDFYAAAVGLVPVPAELVGVVQMLEAGGAT